ncbi:hypothetical protein DXT99_26435 [Pontibacter diazotrophicus]|uniref:Uncharacterized protein n=1 Tax=Pontibacter diazotrophicus TaxID=1400979 RepID=A0A3D8KZK4_9BACT|nr:hypothetical protein [Pontibacter diazotrophicus]RDV10377.1 hypothetical protein DXT99_26435 [Pontibacter diazotrophicus]
MKNRLPKELVTISLTDMDFIALELDINNCNIEIKWLRQTNSDEYQRGLKVALTIALELKKELRKTNALVEAYQ